MTRLLRLAVVLAVLAGSQLGHTLVYLARNGAGAARLESAGVHGYYPALTAGLGAAVGALLMGGLLLLAAAHCVGPAGCRPRATARFFDVLAAAFAAQLLLFLGQETIEALAAGRPVPSPVEQLLWGVLGQLPAAAIAASVIAWLLARIEAAWTAVVEGSVRLVPEPPAPTLALATWPDAIARTRLASAFPRAFRKRGPPRRPA